MNKPEMELKKERDFTDVFNASFAFITQELKKLFQVITLYAGVPIIIATIMSAYYVQDTFTSVLQVVQGGTGSNTPSAWLVLLTIIFGMLAQLFISGLVPAYFGEYEEKGKGNFSSLDVWNRFVRHFGAIIGYSIVAGVIVIFGVILLVIPAIYLWVPLSFILYVKIIEDKGFGETFSRCFQLIRNNWWITFGILLLSYLIISIVGTLFSMPAMIIAGVEGFLVGSGQQEAVNSDSLAFIITTILGGLGQYLIYPVWNIIVGFQYYSLREQKDRETLMDKVSAINEDV